MNEIRVCPACGYGRGFHVSFQPDGDRMQVHLICPSCGQSYALGWSVDVPADARLQEGPAYPSRDG